MDKKIRNKKTGKGKYAVLHGLWTILAMTIVMVATSVIGIIAAGKKSPSMVEPEILIAGIIGYLLIPPVVLGLPSKLRGHTTTKRDLGIDRMPKMTDAYWGILGTVIIFALTLTVSSIMKAFGAPAMPAQFNLGGASGWQMILVLIMVTVAAPIVEEIIFRGYLYGGLRRNGVGLIISFAEVALLFSVFHVSMSPITLVITAIASIGLTMLREETGAIWAGMVTHALNNSVVILLIVLGISL